MDNHKSHQSAETGPRAFYGHIIVIVAFFSMAISWGSYYVFGIFFKPVIAEFGWTRAMTAGAFSLSQIMRGLMGIVMGRLNDKLGPRVVITICGFLLGAGYLLMSQINSVWQLYLFYGIIIGVGMSGFWVPIVSTVARWFAKRRSLMTGIVLTATGIAVLLGAPAANWLISAYDWRMSYIIIGGIVLVIILAGAQVLRKDPAQMGQLPDGANINLESRATVKSTDFSLREAINTRQFWLYGLSNLFFGYCIFTIAVHIAPHATELGISAGRAATVLAAVGGMNILGRITLGIAADRFGNRQIYIMCFFILTAALFWLVPVKQLWALYLFTVFFGFAQGGLGTIGSPLLADLFGLTSHGLIYGVINIGHTVGAALGPFLSGYIFDVTGSYRLAFLACAIMGIFGLILAALLTPTARERDNSAAI